MEDVSTLSAIMHIIVVLLITFLQNKETPFDRRLCNAIAVVVIFYVVYGFLTFIYDILNGVSNDFELPSNSFRP